MKHPDLRAPFPTLLAALLIAASATAGAAQQAAPLNDYPTEARADYVFACMAANGQTRRVLEQCSCSVDHVAGILSYEDYVRAETALRSLQMTGENAGVFRNSERIKNIIAELRRAQAEADIVCF